jgi:hypothetical protein
MKEEPEISEEIKKLVMARIDARMPANIKMSIGSSGSLSKEEMIDHVKKGDEEGRQIVNMHMNFIKAVSNGDFTKELNTL